MPQSDKPGNGARGREQGYWPGPTLVSYSSSICLFQKFKMDKHFRCNLAHPVCGHWVRVGNLACCYTCRALGYRAYLPAR